MLRLLPLALATLGLLVVVPAPAAACAGPDCLQPIVVCQDAIPWMCFEVDPETIFESTWIDDRIRDLIGPCTCDPIE